MDQDELKRAIEAAFLASGFVATGEVATTLYLAEVLGKPLLLEGPPGVGKTEIGKLWAAYHGAELIRLQCYEGLDESRALYEWAYGKQMLYTQLLRDKTADLLAGAADLADGVRRLGAQADAFFSREFLLERPLLRAITARGPVVLLVDEIDRADEEFEAFLLELLSDFQVSVPELGTIRAAKPPRVVLTSNDTRDLADALRRRCLYLHVDYPGPDDELRIVERRVPGLSRDLAERSDDGEGNPERGDGEHGKDRLAMPHRAGHAGCGQRGRRMTGLRLPRPLSRTRTQAAAVSRSRARRPAHRSRSPESRSRSRRWPA